MPATDRRLLLSRDSVAERAAAALRCSPDAKRAPVSTPPRRQSSASYSPVRRKPPPPPPEVGRSPLPDPRPAAHARADIDVSGEWDELWDGGTAGPTVVGTLSLAQVGGRLEGTHTAAAGAGPPGLCVLTGERYGDCSLQWHFREWSTDFRGSLDPTGTVIVGSCQREGSDSWVVSFRRREQPPLRPRSHEVDAAAPAPQKRSGSAGTRRTPAGAAQTRAEPARAESPRATPARTAPARTAPRAAPPRVPQTRAAQPRAAPARTRSPAQARAHARAEAPPSDPRRADPRRADPRRADSPRPRADTSGPRIAAKVSSASPARRQQVAKAAIADRPPSPPPPLAGARRSEGRPHPEHEEEPPLTPRRRKRRSQSPSATIVSWAPSRSTLYCDASRLPVPSEVSAADSLLLMELRSAVLARRSEQSRRGHAEAALRQLRGGAAAVRQHSASHLDSSRQTARREANALASAVAGDPAAALSPEVAESVTNVGRVYSSAVAAVTAQGSSVGLPGFCRLSADDAEGAISEVAEACAHVLDAASGATATDAAGAQHAHAKAESVVSVAGEITKELSRAGSVYAAAAAPLVTALSLWAQCRQMDALGPSIRAVPVDAWPTASAGAP
eukprot:TRINITY_DN21259_c0_g1_i1.p1 TRINITY_DN21259_c0_g1~~TRINITY_DN21259_c0_g1_i1.p1  ORF type:complete len:637 (+),score=167.84 TRINITY_DN21259_c0_g1_i1:60-1913(+)